jgi:hypothetical protein
MYGNQRRNGLLLRKKSKNLYRYRFLAEQVRSGSGSATLNKRSLRNLYKMMVLLCKFFINFRDESGFELKFYPDPDLQQLPGISDSDLTKSYRSLRYGS